ncbi:MAG: triose-phosphate isomerase [Candidatus Thermoplasmatota archaeon]|nr:triose-phosphate isomerase [Candidatus Thermoplasmatota archaeon]MBS3789593.1 triose-phosphate isomerase [Candidatus Thermoplasmatota archaeon]
MFETPIIIVNYKTYAPSIGDKAVELTRTIEKNCKKNWAVVPQTADVRAVNKNTDLSVLSQHVDAVKPGSNTGHTLLETMIDAGIDGTLINHSENQLKLSDIEYIVKRCQEKDIETIVCANNPDVAASAAALGPGFVAYEPPELIGGDISVSSAKPEVVEEAVKKVKDVNKEVKVLCGAGVKDGDDVKAALDLGTKGVLLASGLVKAKNKEEVIKDLENGIL